jgi:hypothetical protein
MGQLKRRVTVRVLMHAGNGVLCPILFSTKRNAQIFIGCASPAATSITSPDSGKLSPSLAMATGTGMNVLPMEMLMPGDTWLAAWLSSSKLKTKSLTAK